MNNLRTNLDTYRVVAEVLEMIRAVTRKVLTKQHGEAWEEMGIPQPMRGFLEQRRDREATIQWRLPDSHDLLEFAGFENLAEIILSNKTLERAFSAVSHDSDLLRARFLELDAIQNRIAYIRPVSDVELEFVVSLSERVRRVTPEAPQPVPVASPGAESQGVLDEAIEAPDTAAPAASQHGATESRAATQPARDTAAAPPEEPAPRERSKGKAPAVPHVSTKELEAALQEGRDETVLMALYNEVTRLAEALWSEASALSTPVWDRIRESEWFKRSFSRLSLKAVSDFYALHRDAGRRLAEGASRTELQELLQERRFGEVLMTMRELFRKYLVK